MIYNDNMTTKHIDVTDNSEAGEVPVRRRNIQGRSTTALSITIPKELNTRINDLIDETKQSRSFLISELLEEALEARKG